MSISVSMRCSRDGMYNMVGTKNETRVVGSYLWLEGRVEKGKVGITLFDGHWDAVLPRQLAFQE